MTRIGLTFDEHFDLRVKPRTGADPAFHEAAQEERDAMFPMATGGGVAISWAAVDPRVAGVLAMSPFADGQTTGDTVRHLLTDTAPVVARLLRPLLGDATFERVGHRIQRKLGHDLSESAPLVSLPRTRAPVLLVHGEADPNVPVSNSRRLLAARPEGTDAWFIPGADHISYLYDHEQELHDRLLGWVQGLQEAHRARDPTK